jgi:hypothetical protein
MEPHRYAKSQVVEGGCSVCYGQQARFGFLRIAKPTELASKSQEWAVAVGCKA